MYTILYMYLYPLLCHEVKIEGTWFGNKRLGIYNVGRNVTKIVSENDQEIPQSKPQTTLWHLEEEPLNHRRTPGRQIKQSNQLSLWGFQQSKIKPACAEQSRWMRRLVCAFVVRKLLKTGFLALRPMLLYTLERLRY